MLKNVKLGVKMIGGFLIVALIILVVGVVSWIGATQLNGEIDEIGNVRLPSIEALLMAEISMEEMLVAQRTLMSEFLNADARARQLEHFHQAREELYAQWEHFKTLPATDQEARISDRIDVDLAEWSQHNDIWLRMMGEFHARGVLDAADLVGTFYEARGDYYAIAGNVVEYIAFDDAFDGGDQASETTLGQWLAEFDTENTALLGLMRQFDAPMAAFHASVRDIRALVAQGERAQADAVYHDRLLPAELQIFDLLYTGIAYAEDADAQRDEMNQYVMGPLYNEARDVMTLLDELIHINERIADDAVAAANALSTSVIMLIVVAMIVGVVIAIILGVLLTRAITKPVQKGVAFAERIALGELDIELDVQQKDEIGVLAEALREMLTALQYKSEVIEQIAGGDFTVEVQVASEKDGLGQSLVQMVASLSDTLTQTREAAEQVQAGAAQVSQASQDLSQGATEQASSLEEISSSINQVNGQSRQNADNATEANGLAKQAATNADEGNQQMAQLREAMAGISFSSNEIKKVVKVIDDIAFQINLLALNANVEAARAGKYGKGFAVVADEVRNLAVRSAEAVKETTAMVEESVKSIESGNAVTEITAKKLGDILEGATKVAQFLEEIAAASGEQAQAVDQITDGLGQIDQVTQANTASAEESASASEELASQAEQLMGVISRFRVTATAAGGTHTPAQRTASGHGRRVGAGVSGQQEPAGVRRTAAPAPAGVGARDAGDGHGRESRRGAAPVEPSKVIKLDDDDFGRF